MLLQELVQQEEQQRRNQQRKLTVQVLLNLLQPMISMVTIKLKKKLSSRLPMLVSHPAVVVLHQPVEVPHLLVKIHG